MNDNYGCNAAALTLFKAARKRADNDADREKCDRRIGFLVQEAAKRKRG